MLIGGYSLLFEAAVVLVLRNTVWNIEKILICYDKYWFLILTALWVIIGDAVLVIVGQLHRLSCVHSTSPLYTLAWLFSVYGQFTV